MPMDAEDQALWDRYKENPTREARDALILHYESLVRYVVGRVRVGMPDTVEYDDLNSYGILGLMDAIERFDPDKGVKFETYAMTRIRGAIIDELRSVDWVPRSVRAKARELAKATQSLQGTLQRTPTEDELAEHMGLSMEEVADCLNQVQAASVGALDESVMDDDESLSLVDTLEDSAHLHPEEHADDFVVRSIMANAVSGLSEREKTVVALYYAQGLNLAEVGKILGVTESRVCQIHTRAVLSLRAEVVDRAS